MSEVYKITQRSLPTVTVAGKKSGHLNHLLQHAKFPYSMDVTDLAICADWYEDNGLPEHAQHLRDCVGIITHNTIELLGIRRYVKWNKEKKTQKGIETWRMVRIFTLSTKNQQERVFHPINDDAYRDSWIIKEVMKEKARAYKRDQRKSAREEAKDGFVNPYQEGDIIYSLSPNRVFAYFYQVMKTTKFSLLVKRVYNVAEPSEEHPGDFTLTPLKNRIMTHATNRRITIVFDPKTKNHSLARRGQTFYLYETPVELKGRP